MHPNFPSRLDTSIRPGSPEFTREMHMIQANNGILVIDDEKPFCEVVAEILTNYGYAVQKAFNATQALSLLESFDPALIILDIMMPDIDGLTLVRKLRLEKRFASLPIIVSSAKFLEEDRSAALDAGASMYLTKPFSAQELRASILELLPADTGPA